ncbi:hypothetical protein B0T19DRAFT_438558 [Cercophora scortea]|uniref:LysM domain-containing protein n=1 Tax=Cercophora scortea TaxID=314031 RepID=A0AAE0MGS8_9PEZI|nr:hypothetical protein B0T19DRAFT_438558 [Cercophora scortea]
MMVSTSFARAILLASAAVNLVGAQVQLHNLTDPVSGLTSTCVAVMNQAIACPADLLQLSKGGWETDATLATLCATTCSTGLATYLRRVTGACGTTRYNTSSGTTYLASYKGQVATEKLAAVCLKNPQGEFCHKIIRNLLKIDPVKQQPTATIVFHDSATPEASGVACNTCPLSILQLQLGQPLASNTVLSRDFSSLTSSCSSTGFAPPTTPTSSSWVSVSTSTCVGTTYTAVAGNTCQSVSLAQGLSTNSLLSANRLVGNCTGFPTSGTLCIPTAAKCRPYKLAAGDTCNSLAMKPALDYCENIADLATNNFTICTSNPGGTWVNPGPVETLTTTEPIVTTDPRFSAPWTPAASMPSPTAGVVPGLDASGFPIPEDTRAGCAVYAMGPVPGNISGWSSTWDCGAVARAYSVNLTDMMTWNPSLANSSTANNGSCTLASSTRYCVQEKLISDDGVTVYCNLERLANPDMCAFLAARYNVTIATLAQWNPSLGATCSGYKTDAVSTCEKWAIANITAPATACTDFETNFGLLHARFVAWNPSVKTDCTGVVQGYDYCVSIPGYKPITTTTTTTGVTSASTSRATTTTAR